MEHPMEGKKHTAGKARTFPLAFKEAAARRLLSGASGTALSRELGVRRSVLYRWRDAFRAEGIAGLSRQRGWPAPGHGPPPKIPLDSRDRRIAELERLLEPQTHDQIVAACKSAGFDKVTIDLEGYRSGRLNDTLQLPKNPRASDSIASPRRLRVIGPG